MIARKVLFAFILILPGLGSYCMHIADKDPKLVYSIFENLYDFNFKEAFTKLEKLETIDIDQDLKDICTANYNWWNIATREYYDSYRADMLSSLENIIYRHSDSSFDDMTEDELFALAHAYAYKTRLDMHEDNYVKGAGNLKEALKCVNYILPRADENIKFKLLAGLYHYILGSVLEKHPIFKALFIFSPESDIELGKNYLLECSRDDNPLIHTEATYFLLRVEHELNKRYDEADRLILELINKHPENIYFRSYRILILADSGKVANIEKELNQIEDSFSGNDLVREQKKFIVEETKRYLRKKRAAAEDY